MHFPVSEVPLYGNRWRARRETPVRAEQQAGYQKRGGLWVGNSVGNTDVVGNSDVWYRDRPRGVARDREIQG